MSNWICLPSIKLNITDTKISFQNTLSDVSKPTIFNPFQSSLSLSIRSFILVCCLMYSGFLPSFDSLLLLLLLLCFTQFGGSSHGLNFYVKEDHRSYRHNFGVAKRKPEKLQASTGFEPLTSAIPVQRSTNWANKSTGSRSLNCDSATEILYWCRKIYPESGQKRWLVDGVTLF